MAITDNIIVDLNFPDQTPNKVAKLKEALIDILQSTPLCSMATISSDGIPHINTVYFAWNSKLQMVFWTDPASKHSVNLAANPAIAFTIFDTHQAWGEAPLRGLQAFGNCQLHPNQANGDNAYRQRFPGYGEFIESISADDRERLRSRFYLAVIDRVKVLHEPIFGEENYIDAAALR